jgi:hypothetical protein
MFDYAAQAEHDIRNEETTQGNAFKTIGMNLDRYPASPKGHEQQLVVGQLIDDSDQTSYLLT